MLTSTPAVSLQLYSLRNAITDGLAPVLDRVAADGITTVELYNLLPWAQELAQAMPAAGLRAPTAHARTQGEDQDRLFETAAGLGVQTLIDPHIAAERWTSRDDVARIADDLNATAERAAGHGLAFGYHNHFWELQRLDDGRTALETLAERLSDAVSLEVDVYWAAVGGADVPALLSALGDRVQFLHLKDAPRGDDGAISDDRMRQLPVGDGIIDWPAVLAAAPSVQLDVIEFDEYAGELFDGIARSRAAITALRG